MSSRILPAQDDFRSLWLAADHDADSQTFIDFHELSTADSTGSGDSPKSESSCESGEIYRLVNFIPDEVYELFWIWELARLRQQESADAVDSMDTISVNYVQANQYVLELIRCLTETAPPPSKRFHNTFWRSLTRRMVQRMKASDISRAASVVISCSEP